MTMNCKECRSTDYNYKLLHPYPQNQKSSQIYTCKYHCHRSRRCSLKDVPWRRSLAQSHGCNPREFARCNRRWKRSQMPDKWKCENMPGSVGWCISGFYIKFDMTKCSIVISVQNVFVWHCTCTYVSDDSNRGHVVKNLVPNPWKLNGDIIATI